MKKLLWAVLTVKCLDMEVILLTEKCKYIYIWDITFFLWCSLDMPNQGDSLWGYTVKPD